MYGRQITPQGAAAPQMAPISHRSAVVAPDVLAAPTTSAPSAQNGGSCAANTYNTRVVGVNAYGRTVPSTLRSATTATTNLTVRIPITQLAGAVAYDIYCSIDAQPLWVGRVTEAQRLSGILITGVGVTGAGGVANNVDVQVPGTGQAAATTAAQNTAYAIPGSGTPIDCTGFQYCDFEITMTITGDVVSPALSLLIFVLNSRTQTYAMFTQTPVVLTYGGAGSNLQPLIQRVKVEVRGNPSVWCLIESIAGTGASVNIDAMPN